MSNGLKLPALGVPILPISLLVEMFEETKLEKVNPVCNKSGFLFEYKVTSINTGIST